MLQTISRTHNNNSDHLPVTERYYISLTPLEAKYCATIVLFSHDSVNILLKVRHC